jgi:phosphoenolpyruvate carboxykinase (ATP)
MHTSNRLANRTWLKKVSLDQAEKCYWQLSAAELVEHSIRNQEGVLSEEGALVCHTGKFTGRSPQDKFIVEDDITRDTVYWSSTNTPLSPTKFDALYKKMVAFLKGKCVYIRDSYVNPLPAHRLCLRIVTTQAWQNLFAHHLFLQPTAEEYVQFVPDFLVMQVPAFQALPSEDGTRNGNFTIINFRKKIILIGGTGYAGEMKKAVFTVLNYLLPIHHQILPMHCAVNVGKKGDTAFFFGLSGTGKTSLSADRGRALVGDDEHGWYNEGVFNFEGGCYAKTINLTKDKEAQIFNAIRFGTIIENMNFKPETRKLNYRDSSITENMRAAYPLSYAAKAVHPAIGSHPKHIFFLTCDAYGVLPPIAQLDMRQVIYYFLVGYTAKVAGTENNIVAPKASFSPCFGAPFLPLPPTYYASLLAKKLERNPATVWLLNTGWVGGGYGVGKRIDLKYTRAMVKAALSGVLEEIGFVKDPIFGLLLPKSCPDVLTALLTPAKNWQDPASYNIEAYKLLNAFDSNFKAHQLDSLPM